MAKSFQSKREGEKKRNVAWRPLPKSILRRVCELAWRKCTLIPRAGNQRRRFFAMFLQIKVLPWYAVMVIYVAVDLVGFHHDVVSSSAAD
ncbi:hypothetical protein SASPL_111681 [Salvia splendens]|uniref:Uncharacterized protein n=1 Tax=Salvia splendens TaxID=180675 RepID=A0A8X9A4K0_SALSN|nr:hypothetical protein SASPL_111681 [Salvia splendens]